MKKISRQGYCIFTGVQNPKVVTAVVAIHDRISQEVERVEAEISMRCGVIMPGCVTAD